MAHITSSAVVTAVKWPGPKAEHLHPSSSEVKDGWNCTHIPPIDLYGMYKNNFICRKLGEFRLDKLSPNNTVNFLNLTPTGQDICLIIGYSGLSYGTSDDVSSYRLFFVTACILGLYNKSEEQSIWISPSTASLGSSGFSSVFSGVFIAEVVDRVGGKGSADATMGGVHTLFEV
jgi:hypothetical protein